MPVDADRFRVKTNPDGSKVRLAFKGSTVVEAKKLTSRRGRGRSQRSHR